MPTILPGVLDALRAQIHLPDEIIAADTGTRRGYVSERADGPVARATTSDIFALLDADVLPRLDPVERMLVEFF